MHGSAFPSVKHWMVLFECSAGKIKAGYSLKEIRFVLEVEESSGSSYSWKTYNGEALDSMFILARDALTEIAEGRLDWSGAVQLFNKSPLK